MKRAAERKAPVFYDCEASNVGGLPIEIGWAFADLVSGETTSESHLIKPPPNWDLGPVWDLDAEKLHKVTREEFYAHGRTPVEIAGRMNKALAGRGLPSSAAGTEPASDAAKAEAARIAPIKHRAEADARHLAALWLMILRGPHAQG